MIVSLEKMSSPHISFFYSWYEKIRELMYIIKLTQGSGVIHRSNSPDPN